MMVSVIKVLELPLSRPRSRRSLHETTGYAYVVKTIVSALIVL